MVGNNVKDCGPRVLFFYRCVGGKLRFKRAVLNIICRRLTFTVRLMSAARYNNCPWVSSYVMISVTSAIVSVGRI